MNNLVEYQSNKNKINVIVFFSAALFAAILIILIFKSEETNPTDYKNNLIFSNGLICLEGESFPFTGRMLDTLDNKMMVEFDVVNGLKNGEYFLFSVSGKLKAYGFMENNKNTGIWEYYYENGQLECKGEFNNDKPSGNWVWYYENGIRKCEGIYLNGMPEGNWMKYDDDGYPGLVIKYYSGEVLTLVEIQKPKMI